MTTIDIQQLHDETRRFVLAAQQESVAIQAGGQVVAVLGPPPDVEAFRTYWQQREQALAPIRLTGPWESGGAVSGDRGRL